MISITRYHDISCGHRVYGHEGRCAHLHGHNYRIHFTITSSQVDELGVVLDFGEVKRILCQWLEDRWDHRFLVYHADPIAQDLLKLDSIGTVYTDFNPTAENMAKFLVSVVGPGILPRNVKLVSVTVEETRKCSSNYTLEGY